MGTRLPPSGVETTRMMYIGAAALLASLVGFLSVVRDRQAPDGFSESPAEVAGTAPGALSYSELRARQDPESLGLYELGLKQLREALPALTDAVVQTEGDRANALRMRASNRAFNGAPPTVPHAVDQSAEPNCLACHQTGVVIAGKVAPAMSHAPFVSCLQCHVVQKAPAGLSETPYAGNEFVPSLGFAQKGSRAWSGAPPTVPHSAWMRENCGSCHGVTGRLGMRSTHPDRANCKQCHALSAEFDQRAFSSALVLSDAAEPLPSAGH